jgi:hemerythrin-like domain-containing protein
MEVSSMREITQILRHEHETVIFVLKILDNIVRTKAAENSATFVHCTELVEFLHLYAEKSHHGKEKYLIEALKDGGFSYEGDSIGIIQHEHEQGRSFVVHMSRALEAKDVNEFYVASVQYSALLENSIKRENMTLFKLADQALDEQKQDELLEEFVELEKAVIGRDLYRNMHDMISTWTASFGVG